MSLAAARCTGLDRLVAAVLIFANRRGNPSDEQEDGCARSSRKTELNSNRSRNGSRTPVFSLGVKKVDFGGISRPSRAVRSISATLTGRISTAADALPSHFGQRFVESVLVGHGQWDISKRRLQPTAIQGAYAIGRPGSAEARQHPSRLTGTKNSSVAIAARVSEHGRSVGMSSNDRANAAASWHLNVAVETVCCLHTQLLRHGSLTKASVNSAGVSVRPVASRISSR